ncbi:MAG: hypothetical protein ABSD71_00330 [Bacteroidales bacterium]|jgi:hypothetical protein
MKKVAVLFSTCILFASLIFAQTPQTQDKGKAAPAKSETTMKKDGKNCSKTCTKDQKAGCCAKKGADNKDTKAPEKK